MNKPDTANVPLNFMQKSLIAVLAMGVSFGASTAIAAELAMPGPTSPAEEQSPVDSSADSAQALPDALIPSSPPYEYQLSARPDPFKPFIAPKTVNPNEVIDDERELVGMQLFEPGQLTLVATMDTPDGRVAMVEDVTKKGYMLKEGILIGRYGEVTEIRRDQVVVTETAYTRGGEQIKTIVSMKLKRDGEG